MSDSVTNNASTESICTVIENSRDSTDLKISEDSDNDNELSKKHCNGKLSTSLSHDFESDTVSEKEGEPTSVATKLKKSVSFDPNDEKVRKFIAGSPIEDQQNPFISLLNSAKKKKTPPPVPTRHSTLSIKKTVTQQLREREREREKEKDKDKERERLKNSTNNRKSNLSNGKTPTSPDEFVTTEEVLKQSKYVKTYIKNPDPFFVYDPTVLARIKFEELRDFAKRKPQKKLKSALSSKERTKDTRTKANIDVAPKPKQATFKKCSKPNYPELCDIKVRVGPEKSESTFNPAEVSKNAKKFDERVKKLHIDSDVDLDEIEGPLTKSESSDEITANNSSKENTVSEDLPDCADMSSDKFESQPEEGTFTGTIKSREFQEYLNKKGLTLIPKKIPNGAQPLYVNGLSRPNNHVALKVPDKTKISNDTMDSQRNGKKPSVFQRLLSNSIFASRRKTTPKESVPIPKQVSNSHTGRSENGNLRNLSSTKRVVLERQSFHGRPRASNTLSSNERIELRKQPERSRKSFASGDDLSVSISSALTNAEFEETPVNYDTQLKPIAKPPRRSISRDRVGHGQQHKTVEQQDVLILKPKPMRSQGSIPVVCTLPKDAGRSAARPQQNPAAPFRRTLERQSLIPKRSTQVPDKRQVFGRSASMDRNEILKRSANRALQDANRSKSTSETIKIVTIPTNSKENVRDSYISQYAPKLTSTPIKNVNGGNFSYITPNKSLERPVFVQEAQKAIYVDQHEWDKLRAIKEQTDREIFYKMVQQQQQQQQHHIHHQLPENVYERLPTTQTQVIVHQPMQRVAQPSLQENGFVRGSPQRNTFAGLTNRNRQVKVIDGHAVIAKSETQEQLASATGLQTGQSYRSQSVLDGVTNGHRNGFRRGYESDNETPVVLRRKNVIDSNTESRRIGGILTREEILAKVKDFCRKSLNKSPRQIPQTDISPVSYASVETQMRPGSRMYAAPQIPQRLQSLPQHFVPISHEIVPIQEQSATSASPIYAHVVKRSSLQSNHSDIIYETPPRQYLVRRESENRPVFIAQNTIQRPENAFAPTQYVIVEREKVSPAQLINFQQAEVYTHPQYIHPNQLQPLAATYGYGYVVQQPAPQSQTVLRTRLHDGRSTPLILDSSSQQASQIYWTPQHQRLQQYAGLPVQISPRYAPRQPQMIPAQKTDASSINRVTGFKTSQQANIPISHQTQGYPTVVRTKAIAKQLNDQMQMQQKRQTASLATENGINGQYPYEWESGSEAGEVQRILEHQRNNDWLSRFKAQLSQIFSKRKCRTHEFPFDLQIKCGKCHTTLRIS